MKYADVMGSGVTIYTPGFTKIGSDGQKLMGGGGNSKTRRQRGDRMSLL
jgi:hypothetical protein